MQQRQNQENTLGHTYKETIFFIYVNIIAIGITFKRK